MSKNAMILSAGGSAAAYEVGVMKALIGGVSPATKYQPALPDVFAGTSSGAFNAAIMASRPDLPEQEALEFLEWIWLNRLPQADGAPGGSVYRLRANPLDYLSPASWLDPVGMARALADDAGLLGREGLKRGGAFVLGSGGLTDRIFSLVDISIFFSVEPLARLLPRVLNIEAVRTSPRLLRIALTNWRTGAVRIVANEHMIGETGYRCVMAALAIPGIFPPVAVDGELFVDGAVVMNTPLAPAIECGADVLHVVSIEPDLGTAAFRRPRSTIETFDRTMSIMFAATTDRDVDVAAQINRGLEAMDRTQAGTLDPDVERALLLHAGHAAAGRRYRKLEIHRYRPTTTLGGAGRWLDFEQGTITDLIERGFLDTVEHDCTRQRCALPQ